VKVTTRSLERPRCPWRDDNQIDMKELGWSTVDWINMAQDRNILRVLVNRQ